MAAIEAAIEQLVRSIDGLANAVGNLCAQGEVHIWRDIVAPSAAILTALAAIASVRLARKLLRAQMQPMVIYQSDFEDPSFEKTKKPDQVGKVALINGGNGIALNVRARSRHVDAKGENVGWHHAPAIHVGGSHFLNPGHRWYEASEARRGKAGLVCVVINYTDAAGNPYHSIRQDDGNWKVGDRHLQDVP